MISAISPLEQGVLLLREEKDPEAKDAITVDGCRYTVEGEKARQIREHIPSLGVSSKKFDAVLLGLGLQAFTSAKAKAVGEQSIVRSITEQEKTIQSVLRERRVAYLDLAYAAMGSCGETALNGDTSRLRGVDVLQSTSQIDRAFRDDRALLPLAFPYPVEDLLKKNAPNINGLSCEEAKKIIESSGVLERKDQFEYNSLLTIRQFVQHRRANPQMSERDAFLSFSPDTKDDISRSSGSACTGFARDVADQLCQKGLASYVVGGRIQAARFPGHAAVVVPCSDGVVLVDPLCPPQMLAALKPDGEPVVSEAGPPERRFSITSNFVTRRSQDNRRAMYPMIVRYITARGARNFQFLLRPLPNPDVPIMTNYMLVIRDHLLQHKAKDGTGSKIVMDFASGSVLLASNGPGGKPLNKVEIPFALFDSEHEQVDLRREGDPAKREKLAEDLGKVVGNQTLEDFWGHFHAPVQVKELVFALATEENLAMMRALYKEVGRVWFVCDDDHMEANIREGRVQQAALVQAQAGEWKLIDVTKESASSYPTVICGRDFEELLTTVALGGDTPPAALEGMFHGIEFLQLCNSPFGELCRLSLAQREIFHGMSSSELTATLGAPSFVSQDGGGTQTWTYSKIAAQARTPVLGRWILYFQNNAHPIRQPISITITFDKKQKIDTVEYRSSRY